MSISRHTLLLSALLGATAANALVVDFASGIPAGIYLEKADGQQLQDGIYRHIGNDMNVAWTVGQLPGGYGRAALSPTRNADPDVPADNRLTLPTVSVEDGYVLRWDARSLHNRIKESYSVWIECDGIASPVYTCNGEDSSWTTHLVYLDDYSGKDINVTFAATTHRGFILAVDNILIGEPTDTKLSFVSHTPHLVGDSDPLQINGTITNNGADAGWQRIELRSSDTVIASMDIDGLPTGSDLDICFTLCPSAGDMLEYSICAVTADGSATTLYKDFYSCSHFPRMAVLDHCSGTWCNNCPVMELTTSRMERRYSDELFIVDAHINDNLTDIRYWNNYLSDFCFAVPLLVPNRNQGKSVSRLDASDYYATALGGHVPCRVDVKATRTASGEIRIEAGTLFAEAIDNTADRYRMAYMLTADFHNPTNPAYMQQNSAGTYLDDAYYYHASLIRPELMYYENVPVETSAAFGIPLSLGQVIAPGCAVNHTHCLPAPEASDLKVLAMVIDTETGEILNAAQTKPLDGSGIADVDCDSADAPILYFDVLGRPVDASQSGFHITRRGKSYVKGSR